MLIVHGHQWKRSKGTKFLCMFNESWCFLLSMAYDIFLFTLLLIYPSQSTLKLFRDTEAYVVQVQFIILPTSCSFIILFSLLVVLPKYVSEHVFSGHFIF